MNASIPNTVTQPTANALDLRDGNAYRAWRERKLANYPRPAKQIVQIADPHKLTGAETDALLRSCLGTNLALYECAAPVDKTTVRQLARQLGLVRLDGNLCADEDRISSLRVTAEGIQASYVPYSNRALDWHTDGYYNPPHRRILAFLMHCVQDAAQGGVNVYLDPEIVYILLRDHNPEYVRALMHPQTMTIPANAGPGAARRQAQSGPVFSVHPESGSLHMRFTARTRSVVWRDDRLTRQAVALLTDLMANDRTYLITHRLRPGQGLVCNNVLHNRSAFIDEAGHKRLIYRARFYDRVQAPKRRH